MSRGGGIESGRDAIPTTLMRRRGEPPILAYVEPDGTRIPFAALHGARGERERAEEALLEWSRAWASAQVARAHGAPLLETLRELGARHEEARPGSGEVDMAKLLPRYLTERDPHKAGKMIEAGFHVDGDDAFRRHVERLVELTASLALSEAALSNGALSLQSSQRGPDTALSRFVLRTIGAPAVAVPVAVDDKDRPGEVGACLGTIMVRNRYGQGPFEATIDASLDPSSLEFGEEGSVEKASISLEIKFDHAGVFVTRDYFSYRDEAIMEAVRALLRERGLPDRVGWSERGMPRGDAGDIEAGLGLAERLWPDVVSAKRSEAMSARGIASSP